MGDGSALFIKSSINPSVYGGLCSRNPGEIVAPTRSGRAYREREWMSFDPGFLSFSRKSKNHCELVHSARATPTGLPPGFPARQGRPGELSGLSSVYVPCDRPRTNSRVLQRPQPP